MFPRFLVEDAERNAGGAGDAVALGELAGKALIVTLGITRVIEQQSLDVVIQTSADGAAWKEAAVFPQKFYAGAAAVVVDLAARPGETLIRAEWKMSRWGRGEATPMFRFYVFAEAAPAMKPAPASAEAATAG